MAVRLEGVGRVFRARRRRIQAVEDVSLAIPEGEIFGLLGPNGAGKTTTLRMIAGLLRPTTGQVWVNDCLVSVTSGKGREQIGLVSEDAGTHPNLTVHEELRYYGALYGLDRHIVQRRAAPLLERLDLASHAGKRTKTLSRGMRRKLHLVRSLLHEPRLLLLDEPTAGLDPLVTREVWCLLRELVKTQRVTAIVCSHHLEEVEKLCDRLAILQRVVLLEGRVSDLGDLGRMHRVELAHPAEEHAAAVSALDGVGEARGEGCVLHLRLTRAHDQVMPDVVRLLVQREARIVAVGPKGGELRQCYARVVAEGSRKPMSVRT